MLSICGKMCCFLKRSTNFYFRALCNKNILWFAIVITGICAIHCFLGLMVMNSQDKKSTVLDNNDIVVWMAILNNRTAALAFLESKFRRAMQWDKGTGCKFPRLRPFSSDIAWTYKQLKPLQCMKNGRDWVKCYHSKCRVVDSIKATIKNITCEYRDIIYIDDFHQSFGAPTVVKDGGTYTLAASDHVNVSCKGVYGASWKGNTLGFRPVSPPPSPLGNQYNVVILVFDSTPRTGFIRLMPKSWKVLNEELNATVMEGYNILGDGTPSAIFPLLTGKMEMELPDVTIREGNDRTMDDFPFIFKKLKENGFHTAYLEDMPSPGSFQFRFNGFKQQPTDHYLRAFSNANSHLFERWNYCYGDTPQYTMMLNITEQFLDLDGRRFILTFIADITHGDFNLIQLADDDTAAFLRRLVKHTEDTLIIVMGDHGPRYPDVRRQNALRGKLDERLPLMAIRLPSRLTRARPDALSALEANAHVVVTVHDLHATLLDVLNMRRHWNPYIVPGADLKRGLTLLEAIPSNRSCSEAGIETHWCSCLVWENVSLSDPFYNRTARALIDYINFLIDFDGSPCVPRSIAAIGSVLRQRPNTGLLAFTGLVDYDFFFGKFKTKTPVYIENYQIAVEANPGGAAYEATLTYDAQKARLMVQPTGISRVNSYRGESDCILASHPHLAPYCYCKR